MKQFIKHLDEEKHFGIMELDDTHILLYTTDPKILDDIQTRLDELLNSNTFELNTELRDKQFRVVD